jgi:phosphosulfolactate synthase
MMINGTGKMTWEGIISDPLGGRVTAKPRKSGKTIISDLGYGLGEVSDFLSNCGYYIDRAKLAFGTSVLYSEDYLKEKIRLYRQAGINVNPGGTCAEIAIYQGVYDSWLKKAKELGFTTIEISDGTIPMDQALREKVIGKAVTSGFEVVSEVGKKDEKNQLTLAQTIDQIKKDAQLGVKSITVEARGSAKGIGVFGADGKVKADDVDAILNAGVAAETFVWEAPTKDGQEFFINRLGNNVNLGNVRYFEVIALEGLRRGLRGDTLRMAIQQRSR